MRRGRENYSWPSPNKNIHNQLLASFLLCLLSLRGVDLKRLTSILWRQEIKYWQLYRFCKNQVFMIFRYFPASFLFLCRGRKQTALLSWGLAPQVFQHFALRLSPGWELVTNTFKKKCSATPTRLLLKQHNSVFQLPHVLCAGAVLQNSDIKNQH